MPFYDDVISYLSYSVCRLASRQKEVRTLVDLGAGTGNLAFKLAREFPLREVKLVDHSDEMRHVARERYEQIADLFFAAEFLPEDFNTKKFKQKLGRLKPDIVTASFALDHIRQDLDLEELFIAVHSALPEDGIFALVEKCANGRIKRSVSWRRFKAMIAARKQFIIEQELMDQKGADAWEKHIMEEDYPRPLEQIYGLLKKVGFKVELISGVEIPDNVTRAFFSNRTILKDHPFSSFKDGTLMRHDFDQSKDKAYAAAVFVARRTKSATDRAT